MDRFKIIFVHGYTASSRVSWYPPVSKELKKLNVDFEIPDMPGGEHPHAEDWLNKLHQVISKTDKPLVLVGHSLGTRTILLYLETYKPKNLKLVLLVAAFSNKLENGTKYDDPDSYPDFFTHLINIEEVKKLSEKFVVMHSKDDELPFSEAEEIAKELGAKFIGYEDRGHISDPENAPEILGVLRQELGF